MFHHVSNMSNEVLITITSRTNGLASVCVFPWGEGVGTTTHRLQAAKKFTRILKHKSEERNSNRTTRININRININPNSYYNPVIDYYKPVIDYYNPLLRFEVCLNQ